MPPEDILKSQVEAPLTIVNGDHLVVSSRVLVAGLGGSRLAGALLRDMLPDTYVELHSGFDTPKHAAFAGSTMIASSTSGDTVETISAYEACGAAGFSRAVLTRGGDLLRLAQRDLVPYVVMPASTMPPRETFVHSLRGHCVLMGQHAVEQHVRDAFAAVDTDAVRAVVASIEPLLRGKSVLLYAPDELESLMRYIKVNLNETARVPAYIGLIPEILHGEIAVLEGGLHGPALREQLTVLQFHTDDTDPRIVMRMQVLAEVVRPRGVGIETLVLPGRGWPSVAYGATFALMLSHALREYGSVSREGENLIGAFKRTMRNRTT